MSNNFKRIAAASLAIVCAASLSGCSDNGYIGTVNGMQIPNGLYIYLVAEKGYYEAQSAISEEQADTIGTGEVTVFTETIDGKAASVWLKDYAQEQVKRYAAVETLFKEYGLSLSAEDIEAINDSMKSLETELGYYAQYYGIEENTFLEHYENMGISKASLRSFRENLYKENAVFLHNYDTDGLTPVTDEEINTYITENNASVKLLKLSFTDYQGLLLDTDEEIQEVRDLAKKYADRYNSTGDWLEIQYDYDLRQAQFDAWVDADDKYAEEHSSTAEASTKEAEEPAEETAPVENTADTIFTKIVVTDGDAEYNAYVQAAIDAATATKKESADECDRFISKASSSLDEKVTEYIWNTAADGKATLFEPENGSCIYVVVREDITTKETWKSEQHESLLHSIRNDAFEELLKNEYADYAADFDDYLVNKKYAPENLKGIGK